MSLKTKKFLSALFTSVAIAIPAQVLVAAPADAAVHADIRLPKHLPAKFADFYHVPKGTPEYAGDSIRAIKIAAGRHEGIDLNFQVDKEGDAVNTHWAQPLMHGFTDPEGKIKKKTKVWEMTWAQLSRLRAPGGYRIHKAATMFRAAAKRHVRIEFEAKDSPAFKHKAVWQKVKAEARAAGLDNNELQMKTLTDITGGQKAAARRIECALAAGIPAIILPRSGKLSRNLFEMPAGGPGYFVRKGPQGFPVFA